MFQFYDCSVAHPSIAKVIDPESYEVKMDRRRTRYIAISTKEDQSLYTNAQKNIKAGGYVARLLHP